MSKQGSEKKEFVRGMSNYPPSHPRSSPSGFSGASVLFHHPDSGTEERQVCGEKGVGGGHPPQKKTNLIRRKQCSFRNYKQGVGDSCFSEQSRSSLDMGALTWKILGSLVKKGLVSCYSKSEFCFVLFFAYCSSLHCWEMTSSIRI